MKMRLVGKQVAMNPETFAPELLVTVAMPLEPIKYPVMNTEEEAFDIIGAEFAALFKEPKGWICSKCGVDRTKSACPKGDTAALTGECPMVGTAYSGVEE